MNSLKSGEIQIIRERGRGFFEKKPGKKLYTDKVYSIKFSKSV